MDDLLSDVFEWFESAEPVEWCRYEVGSPGFLQLRQGVYAMLSAMLTEQESSYEASLLRSHLFQWLMWPTPFASIVTDAERILGLEQGVQDRWGQDVAANWRRAQAGIGAIRGLQSPLVVHLEEVLEDAFLRGRRVGIFCQRAARGAFLGLSGAGELAAEDRLIFLHTPTDYRSALPFDELVRVGPLKSQGYGSALPALVTAPRYGRLTQVVWAGLNDDPDFSLDPVLVAISGSNSAGAAQVGSSQLGSSEDLARPITPRVISIGDLGAGSGHPAGDEIARWREARPRGDNITAAVVFFLGNGAAIPFAHQAEVTTAWTEGGPPLIENVPAAAVKPGLTYLVWQDIGEIDLGETQATDGALSTIWKRELLVHVTADSRGLERRLRQAGLKLQTLHSCIRHWLEPSGTVIHAPQQRAHFAVLADVLGIEGDPRRFPRPRHLTWAQAAWREIARSRGEAIQDGMQVGAIRAEEANSLLAELLADGVTLAGEDPEIVLEIPPGRSLEGRFRLLRVDAVESAFVVPAALLGEFTTSERVEEWRA